MKAHSDGDKKWHRTFGRKGWHEEGHSVQQTSDGIYIIAGAKDTYKYFTDVYLIKTNSRGRKQWSRTFSCDECNYGRSVQQTRDGYIIVGYSELYGGYNRDVYLIKTDKRGNKEWESTPSVTLL